MISDQLPAYYEAFGNNPTYEVVESFVLCGHEVAWMRHGGSIQAYDDNVERTYESFGLKCECDFIRGTGWDYVSGYASRLMDSDGCRFKSLARHLRRMELRSMYAQTFKSPFGIRPALFDNLGAIIADLIERTKRYEFIGEDGGGAAFYGGYFYLQTVADIVDEFIGHMWSPVHKLCREKHISLDGAVVKDYEAPPPAEWVECVKLEHQDYTGVAFLPGNRHMAREWKLEIQKPDGSQAFSSIPGLRLSHDPVFGPDAEDVAAAEAQLVSLIDGHIARSDRPDIKPVDAQ